MFIAIVPAMTKSEFSKCECRHCGGHIEFPTGAGGQSITCPHCGQAVELPGEPVAAALEPSGYKSGWGVVVLWVVIIAAAIGLIVMKRHYPAPAAGKAPEQSMAPAAPAAKPPAEMITNYFAISAFKLEKTAGNSLVHVVGTVRNLTDKQRFGVKVEFALLDAKGASVGKASDYAGALGPKGEWNFKALVMTSKAAAARLEAVREDQ
jgi:ribosomal protein S27E